MWQVLATPVYVDSGFRADLINILLAAHPVTAGNALERDETRTGGSDFLLRVGGKTVLSTLGPEAAAEVLSHPARFAIHKTMLKDGQARNLAELWAVRSFAGVEARVAGLRRNMVIAWLAR